MRPYLRRPRAVAAALAIAAAVSASAALGASAPAVTTGATSGMTASGATIAATVNPGGEATTYAFQYGTTTNYGAQTPTTKIGSGTTVVSVHVTLSHLVSGTTYHYRVVATNPSGTNSGADMAFVTARTPPVVTSSSPSLVTTASATLVGTVNPEGKATTYSFQYGPTTSYGLQSPTASAGSGASPTSVHVPISGLVAGTVYHYRLVALSADGTSASSDATFSTTGNQPAPGGPLPVVSEAAAVNLTTDSVQLNGAINPEGPTTSWYFQYGLSDYYGVQTEPQTLSGLGARPVNVTVSGLQSGATYHYRLVAVSANGLYVGPDYTFTTKNAARVRPRMPALHASVQHRSGGAVRLLISGSLGLPGTVAAAQGCTGAVAIEISHGQRVIALHRTFVRSTCAFRLTANLSSGALAHTTRLGISARFEGNALLLPATTQRSVRV